MTNAAQTAMSPTEQQAAAYAALFAHFNAKLFGGELPPVILNLSRKSKAHGFFWAERWGAVGDGAEGAADKLHEISLNPDMLGERDPRATASTLVHEMCHLWQCEFGAKYPKRAYHNKEFAAKMAEVGLVCSSTGAPGGKSTGVSMTHYIEEGGAFDRAFAGLPDGALPWLSWRPETKERKRDTSKVKHTCPDCGLNVWCKEGANVVCGECQLGMAAEG